VDGIVVINGEGQIENVNHALTELFGYTAQELLGRNVAMLMPEPHRHQHDDYLRQFNATGKAKVIGIGREVEGRRKDGSLFPVDLSVSELMLAGKRYFVGVIHDITMHKAMESALAEERNFNRLTLDSLLAGIVVLDEKSYILSVNEAWRRLAEEQVATGDLVGCNYLAVCDAATGTSPEQTQAVAEGLRDILSGTQQTFSLEYPCHGPSGQRWFLMRASHFLEAGRPRVVVSHQDITARVVAEESLKRANAQLKMLAMVAQRTSNSVIVTDREGRIVWVNEGFTTSSEYTLQEVMGRRPPEILVGPDSDREVVARLDAAARQGQKIEAEILNYSKSGRRYWVQVEITPILDENGEVEEFIALERDITEQRRLLADLKIAKEGAEHIALDLAKNERLLMLTLSGAGAGFWYFEFATGIMRWDKPSRQIFAVGEEDLSGRYEDWATNMHPEDFPMAQGAFIDALADETVSDFTIDHRVIWPSGEIRYIHVAATIDRDNAREPCSVSGLYFDDTERKRNEAALQQAKDEAEAANRAKSAFLAAMSHEIRTPMNGVVGMIDVLAQTSLTADQQDSLRTIKDSAFSLLAIIDDILDFSKIEAGRLTLERVPVAIEDLVEGVGDTLLPMALKKNIELLVSCDPNIPVAVSTDPVRLRQVLLNLGGNAIKFTGNDSDRKGRVVIRANLEAVRNNRVRLLLRVEDNGIGMSEEVQARLFRPFGQGESSTTRRFGGTGLGLTICRRLVEMMDGRLEMESREGEGSVFSVRLEFAEVPTETEQAADDLTGIGVLLVTSERTVYSICESYLSQMGVPVVGMESAGEMAAALRALSESHDQVVVILDCPGVPRSLQQKQNQERNRALRQRLRQVCTECKPRFLQLERGRRRYPRQNEEDTLSFDLDAMHRETFLHALALVVGRSSAQTANAATPKEEIVVRTPLGLAEAEARGQLILVAEDNETNQKVLLHQLSMLGYTAEIAGNGREALEKWRQVPYGLILTDYHMPEMDGYELAQAIREEEGDKRRYTPIMAITADAFKDTQRRCMACGMDDYIAKPVQLRPLQEKLRWWLPDAAAEVAGSVSDGQEEADAEARDTTQVVDPNALKEVLGVDDPEMLADFYNDFLVTAQQTLDAIADACNTRDAAAAGALGHRLKSSARTVGANTLADCCFELEQAGKAADWVAIDAQVAELPPLLQAVQAWIQRRQ
jgi:PAS domain S-box-containing protein